MQKATCPEGAEDRGSQTQAKIGISGHKSAKTKRGRIQNTFEKYSVAFA
jgi:hypothetical protein